MLSLLSSQIKMHNLLHKGHYFIYSDNAEITFFPSDGTAESFSFVGKWLAESSGVRGSGYTEVGVGSREQCDPFVGSTKALFSGSGALVRH